MKKTRALLFIAQIRVNIIEVMNYISFTILQLTALRSQFIEQTKNLINGFIVRLYVVRTL